MPVRPSHERQRWSFRIVRALGVDVRVHVTFLVFFAWVAVGALVEGNGLAAAATGAASLLLAFGVIVLHELGHVLVARRFGIGTRDVTLLPLGGVATMERLPEKPQQELWIALAGPAVNVALAIGCFAVVSAFDLPLLLDDPAAMTEPLPTQLLWLNISLAAFNILPAFPMDGGRVLRALLALRFPRVRATEIAARIGRGCAVVFGVSPPRPACACPDRSPRVGLLFNPVLVLIAVFVWIGATAEAVDERARALLGRFRVEDAAATDVRVLRVDEPLELAVAFVVDDAGAPVGILRQKELHRARREGAERVGDAMDTDVVIVSPREPLTNVLDQLDRGAVLVGEDGGVRGLVTVETVRQLLALS